jgi:site-specific recombinase XerD
MYLSKRSNGVYYVGRKVSGKVNWKSLHVRTKSEALTLLKESDGKTVVSSDITLSALSAKIESSHLVCPSTMRMYLSAMGEFQSLVGDRSLSAYTQADAERFKSSRTSARKIGRETLLSPLSVNMALRSIKACFSLAVKWEHIAVSPFRNVSLVPISQQLPLYPSVLELQSLLVD